MVGVWRDRALPNDRAGGVKLVRAGAEGERDARCW